MAEVDELRALLCKAMAQRDVAELKLRLQDNYVLSLESSRSSFRGVNTRWKRKLAKLREERDQARAGHRLNASRAVEVLKEVVALRRSLAATRGVVTRLKRKGK